MRKILHAILLAAALAALTACYKLRGHYGTKSYDPVSRPTNTHDILLPEGYQIEAIARELNYPTSLTFDEKGNIYVIEAGYSYGEIYTTPRLLRLDADGKRTEIARGEKNGPWTQVDYHDGNFYIAEGGTVKGGRILKVTPQGKISYLVENLPSLGDHHTNGATVHQGYVYFGQGTATNSAVVGKDNFDFGWLARHKDFHDVPCEDVILAGENYESKNVLSEDKEKIGTGAFVPYGTKTERGQLIKGKVPCSGAIMRVPLAGGEPELVAWGFRNPYGICFNADGRLFVTDNGYDVRGSRPVFGAGDLLWEVKQGLWYGWPDYSGIDSLAGEHFRAREIQPKAVLLKPKKTPPKPVAVFGVHASSDGIDFSHGALFGYTGHAFVAQFGDMSPDVGSIYGPVGFKVVMVDITTGVVSNFAVNKGPMNGPASQLKKGGLERPVSVKFDREGTALYVVDFGVLEVTKKGPAPKQNTGVIWKITRK